MNPIAHIVQQPLGSVTPKRRTTGDRITEELRQNVLRAINEKMPVNRIRRQFRISHATLVKIRGGKG